MFREHAERETVDYCSIDLFCQNIFQAAFLCTCVNKQPENSIMSFLLFGLTRKQIMARKSPKNFEEALARLEVITQTMQTQALPLDEALTTYQEGVELVRFCQQKLAAVEHAIQVLDNDELKELALESE